MAIRIWAITRCGRTAAVNLLDFGAIRVFDAKFVRGVIDLYEAVRDSDDAKAHHAYETWGFTDLSKEKMDVLNLWARFLYEPLVQDRVRRIQETDDPQFGRDVAERVHAGLKRTGGVQAAARVRADGPLGDRAGRRVPAAEGGAELEPLFHELIADFDDRGAGRAPGGGAGGGGGCRRRADGAGLGPRTDGSGEMAECACAVPFGRGSQNPSGPAARAHPIGRTHDRSRTDAVFFS